MAGRLILAAQIRPIDFQVPKNGLFTLVFWSTIEEENKLVGELIEKNSNFVITPDFGKIIMLGRIQKMFQKGDKVSYMFIVDEIRTRKATNESTDDT